MRASGSSFPILHRSSRTPALAEPGIAIVGPDGPTPSGGNATWIHGVLVLGADDLAERDVGGWLRALFVTIVAHDGGGASVINACGRRRAFQDHGEGLVISFNLDLGAALRGPLPPGRYHVRASACQHRSAAIEVVVGAAGKGEGPFPAARPAATPVDRLIQGLALARAGEHARAADALAEALQETPLRADLDASNLYDAACAAARAILANAGKDAERRLAQALAWLGEDLEGRRERLARRTMQAFDAEIAGGPTAAAAAETAAALRADTVAHFRHARSDDADLATLRGLVAFESVFTR